MRALGAALLLTVTLAVLPAGLHAQRTQPDAARRAAEQARRDSLEAEISQKFLERLTRDLRLDADQRTRVERIMEGSGQRRRDLMQASLELRGRMHRALRSSTTTDAEFMRLLGDHETLRGREHELWRRDQDELAAVLSARQRVQFIISWAGFQETMREILSQRRQDDEPAPLF
jgi:hypothetical protein